MNKQIQAEKMTEYMKQLPKPVEADPTRHPVLGEVSLDHSVCDVLLGSNSLVQQKRSRFDSLRDWSEPEKSQSPPSYADDESQSSEETIEQTDEPRSVLSPGEIVIYPKQAEDEALPRSVESTQGARESRFPQQPSLKRTPLQDITEDVELKKKQKINGRV
jgi:hypothetical protein